MEVLVAVAVGTLVIAAATMTLIQITRAIDISRAYSDAVANGRAALRDMSFEIKKANFSASEPIDFHGANVLSHRGDGIDNDFDGLIDEDRPDGLSDDNRFIDRHAYIGNSRYERPQYIGKPDLGDGLVDEDIYFSEDRLRYKVFASGGETTQSITYYLGTFEGEPNVILREATQAAGPTSTVTVVDPVAFNVLHLNFLYWNANLDPPYWQEFWDSTDFGPYPGPNIELPSSVYIDVCVYVGTKPLNMLGPSEPRPVVRMATVVNLEAVLADPRFQARRPPG